jgi:hypothetical protein
VKRLFLGALGIILPCAVLGCGSGSTVTETVTVGAEESSPSTRVSEPEQLPKADFTVTEPKQADSFEGTVVHTSSIVVRGTADPPNSDVTVNDEPAHVKSDGHFYLRVALKVGENDLTVRSEADGYMPSQDQSFYITRKKTAAQLAQERAEAEADFKASASTIDYDQLIKDPGYYAGDPVVYTGEILQIQQSGNSGFMLVWTSCDEFDICDDPIYVPYDGFRVQGAEGDEITVYGTVKGGYEYDTQGGGTNYVPKVRANYIEE